MNGLETKWTPGPWHVSLGETYKVKEADGSSLAMVMHVHLSGRRSPAQVVANANLIAAAPDLYEALRKAEEFIVNGIEFGFIRMPDASTPDSAHATLPAIRVALAKARGETP